jgi:hypothetical protein
LARVSAAIRRISKQHLRDPEEITVKTKTTTSANTTQRYLMVSYPQKVDALTRILEVENFEGMIVFTRTKNETETLAEKPFASPAGAWHNLKLDASGGKFIGYIDSEPVIEVAASGPTAGKIGLFSQGNRAHFDDVLVVKKLGASDRNK